MHDVKVTMKNGRVFRGPLWDFRPREGWFSIVTDDPDCPSEIRLGEVESAVNYGIRVTLERVEDVDLLDRARREGWTKEPSS